MDEERLGHRFANYRLIKYLRRGDCTDTYLGEHIDLHTQAAIEVLPRFTPERISDQKDRYFLAEARFLPTLSHPHIIRLLEFGIEDDCAFLVWEYGSQETVLQRHHGPLLSLPLVVSYVKQVASALEYAQTRGFVHGAIKPGNMFLGRNDELLLGGFQDRLVRNALGIAGILGRPVYVPPELVPGGPPTPASDQYALAIVVYQWLSGRLPFNGPTPIELLRQHLFAPVPSVCTSMSALPPEVDTVIRTALAKEPQERFTYVQDFADALEAVWQQHP